MTLTRQVGLIGGLLSAVALGSAAGLGVVRTAARPGREIYPDEDFDSMLRDRRSIVHAEDGVPLVVREVGPAQAPLTVVFVHGYCLSQQSWHFQRRDLEERWSENARLVFYDQRGHGESGIARRKSCTIAQLGRDLECVLDATAPTGPVVLVGHSMGGMTVLALAGRRPDLFESRIRGVGLVATTAAGLIESGLARNLQNPIVDGFRLAVRTSPDGVQHARHAVRALIAPILRAASFGTDVSPRLHRMTNSMLNATSVVTVVNFLRTLELHDESAALSVLADIPTLVVCGDADMITPFPNSKRLAAELPQSELVRVRGAGHLVQLEFPAIVTDAIDRLVGRAAEGVGGFERADVG